MGLESADDGVVHLREPLEETREVKDAFAGGEMFVGMAVIVVEVDFMQIRSEDIQPVVEGNVGEDLEVAGVEAEAEGRGGEGVEEFGEGGGVALEYILDEDPGPGNVGGLGEDLHPGADTVLQPGAAVSGESLRVISRMEDHAVRIEGGRSHQGQAHSLDCQSPEGGIDGPGTEIVEGAVDGHAAALLAEGGGKCGEFPGGDRLEHAVVEVDFGVQRIVEEERELFLQMTERDMGLNLGERLSRRGTTVPFDT